MKNTDRKDICNSILNWEIKIDLSIFNKKEREEYKYLENIFSNEIEFWDNQKIKNISDSNYFSVIIWKNWIWKSSFIEYLINYFNYTKSHEKLMYITFSAFDNIKSEKKSETNYIYNWLKSKTHGSVKSTVYNENKIKILNYLSSDKIDWFSKLIKYFYKEKRDQKIVINISYICSKLFDWLNKLDFENDIKKEFFKIIKSLDTSILPKSDIKYIEQYWFFDWHNKDLDIFKVSNILYLYIFTKLLNIIASLDDITLEKVDSELKKIIKEIDFEKMLDISKNELSNFKNENDFILRHKELIKDIAYIKESLSVNELFWKVNSIRKYNSWPQLIKISFWCKDDIESPWKIIFNHDKDNSYLFRDFSFSSSGELVLLYTALYLSDFKNYSWNKIVLIDEPEISLHPQWQRDYFEKVNEWLSILWIKNIFFIVVTHSPLIVVWSQDKRVKNADELENKYNADVYCFKKSDESKKTISEKINYISMDSIDEVLWDDFQVSIYSDSYLDGMSKIYDNLLEKYPWKR